jgi:hypothetical protein
VLSDSAFSVLIPILEDILKWNSAQIRDFFESHGLAVQEWDKARTDRVALQPYIRPANAEKITARSRNPVIDNGSGDSFASRYQVGRAH